MTNDTAARTRRLDQRLRVAGWSLAGVLMLTPLAAMQFTDEVAWSSSDFVFAGAMLGGVGLALELTFRLSENWAYRGGMATALAGAFVTVWANGAVGIIGDESNPANMLFYWVLAIGAIGAVISRFKARGMGWAMIATALAQLLVAILAFALGQGLAGPVTLFFLAFWLTSAAFFRNAEEKIRVSPCTPGRPG